MLCLKGCPHCHGDLQYIRDVGTTYVACLQCGCILTDAQSDALLRASRHFRPGTASAGTRKVAT